MIIRKATEEDVKQITEILVENWKIAYHGWGNREYNRCEH